MPIRTPTQQFKFFWHMSLLGALLMASCERKSTYKSRNWRTSGADICIEVECHKEKEVIIQRIVWSEGPKAQAPCLLTASSGRPFKESCKQGSAMACCPRPLQQQAMYFMLQDVGLPLDHLLTIAMGQQEAGLMKPNPDAGRLLP
uniref:Uncharacterized protein n=1 Tax=Romanomermis culicivorax TaxID=13658 RepID=A0A915HJ54_ROMCU